MYLHAVGWQTGKKDKIDLEGPKLKEKEGLYTCPPIAKGQKSFHCCLKVREELIKVQSACFDVASDKVPPLYQRRGIDGYVLHRSSRRMAQAAAGCPNTCSASSHRSSCTMCCRTASR